MTKVILGGGLSGLSAAYYSSKLTHGKQIILIEASDRLGGWIKSKTLEDGVIFEQGPRTIRPKGVPGVNTLNLVEELGLSQEIISIKKDHVAAKNRMIYVNGELHLLPNSVISLIQKTKPFSKPLILQLLGDLGAKAKVIEDDSIYNFTQRRFGMEVADYLISPMIAGICAGNAKEISVKFLMRNLFNYEQKYGNISKGILRHLFNKNSTKPVYGPLAKRSKIEKWNVYSFKNGMETLPKILKDAISKFSNVNIQTDSPCQQINFKGEGASVSLKNGKEFESSHIISSISSKNLASILGEQHRELANMLNNIKTVSVAVVNLMYKGNHLSQTGFGFLVPPKEKLPILGVVFDSCFHQYQNYTVLTVMLGGYWFKELFGSNPSKDFLFKTAAENIKVTLNIKETPLHYEVHILKDCIPQYVVGHEKNLSNIESYIKAKRLPLSLCGSSYYGVGVNDVILSAKNAVEKLIKG